MKIKIEILTDDGHEVGRSFYTSDASGFVTETIYEKLLNMLVREVD